MYKEQGERVSKRKEKTRVGEEEWKGKAEHIKGKKGKKILRII